MPLFTSSPPSYEDLYVKEITTMNMSTQPVKTHPADLPPEIQLLQTFLLDASTRTRIARARRLPGFEKWLHVELAMFLGGALPTYDVDTSVKIFQSVPVDVWCEPRYTMPPTKAAGAVGETTQTFGFELRVADAEWPNSTLESRLSHNMRKFASGQRRLEEWCAAQQPKLFAVGLTSNKADCLARYAALERYPDLHLRYCEVASSRRDSGALLDLESRPEPMYLIWARMPNRSVSDP